MTIFPIAITSPRPSAAASSVRAYVPPPRPPSIDLWLDSNERRPDANLLADLQSAVSPADFARYPSAGELETMIATRLGVDPGQVLVTAGADEAIERACRAYLQQGRTMLTTTPTFEMIPRSARLAGANVQEVSWESGRFPTEAVIEEATAQTAMIAVVTPNNPTGAVAQADDLRRLSAAAPQALLLVDLAYTEFADEDLTPAALDLPNALIVRTFSKAWGLAGLRVGYAVGQPEAIARMRAVGGPYTVSAASIAAVKRRLKNGSDDVEDYARRIRSERATLTGLLRALGASTRPSQANFVLARFADAAWVADGLASLGIAVRRYDNHPRLSEELRITCPGNQEDLQRLKDALKTTLQPQALLFDMDGVLADVSRSYRAAIIQTARTFGVELAPVDVARAKAAGDANNDWLLTVRLLAQRGVIASLEEITDRFEAIYQGADGAPGLRDTESLLISRDVLESLATRRPLGIVTGRPRRDCRRFLDRFGIADLFKICICMEDGPAKPDPAPILRALKSLKVRRAWMIGDTPDDLLAARRAGALPIGVVTPGADAADAPTSISSLTRIGAARVFANPQSLANFLEATP